MRSLILFRRSRRFSARRWRPRAGRALRWIDCALPALGLALGLGYALLSVEAPTAASAIPTAALGGRPQIIDGDTIELNDRRIRLWGIDAPERGQRCIDRNGAGRAAGQIAATHLASVIGESTLRCTAVDTDRFGRLVARCVAAGADVSARMVADGWAWDYARYSGGAYAGAEAGARNDERGVWRWECEPPWQWRRENT